MNDDRAAYAASLLARSREHDERESDRLNRFRNLEPETASLLALLVRAKREPRVLEVGTSNGYSTLWLADAVEAAGGELVSVEIDAARTAQAREHLDRLGLRAELRTEDAAETLRRSPDVHWDLIFLDAERPAYAGYWPDCLRSLRAAGVVAIDNVLSHEDQVAEVTALIEGEPQVETTLVAIGAGLRLAVKGARRVAGSGAAAGAA